jgi:hypothetical protein
MPDAEALETYYKTLTDQELLKLKADGGFTEEAEQTLGKELARRNLTSDEAKKYGAPEWLDKADVGALGVLVLESGERITAEIVGLNEDGDRLSVKVIAPDGLPQNDRRSHRAIPFHRIVSFEPRPHLMERWPFSDPCRDRTFSPPRFVLMTTIFLCLIVGSLPLFLLLTRRPYGLQEASIITYTLFELFFTFARTGTRGGPDLPPYKFKCPAVEAQVPRLLWRHLGFLVALMTLQTAALAVRTHLPDWWNMQDRKGATPFVGALFLLCFALAWVQVRSNRSLLDHAHREFSAQT